MVAESWLVRAARLHPERLAVNTITYADLHASAAEQARAIAPGEPVAIDLPPGEDFAVRLHACLLAGAVAVPGPPTAEQAEVHAIAGHSACSAGGERRWDDVAVVVRTSGTTSEPKAVGLTYGNWLWSALGSAAALGVAPDERWLCAMPLTHVGGLSILIRSAIYGTTAIIHERFDADDVLEELMRPGGATLVSLVPTTLARLLDAGLDSPPDLRTVLLGGAPIPSGLLDRAAAAGVHVTTTYGMTEACSQVATDGWPLFCTKVDLAADGEVLVSGPTVSPDSGPVLHTGDLGVWDADGRLRITGRKVDTIITGGENVSPAEVEAVLERHPAVIEAAVVGVPDPVWGEAVCAVVRLRETAGPSEIEGWSRDHLAPHQRPKRFVVTEAPLPRTGSGKLLRRSIQLP